MFNTSYSFQKLTCTKNDPASPHIISKTLFRFISHKNNRYIVEVHEHEHNLFVVKFYFVKDSKNSKKYNILTNKFEVGGVIRTVVDICIYTLDKVPKASFAFIGVPKFEELKKENSGNNQRFRVYKRITETLLGTETFKHVESQEANAYLVVNKINDDVDSLTELLIQKLSNVYQNLADLLT